MPEITEALLDSLIRGATWHHLTSNLTPTFQPEHPGSRVTSPGRTRRTVGGGVAQEDTGDRAALKVSEADTHP